jgi:hypothetical protein
MDQDLTGMGGVAIGSIIVVLLVVAALVLLFIAIQGMSLKWSVYLVGANPIGFWYGTLTAFVMGLAGGIASIGSFVQRNRDQRRRRGNPIKSFRKLVLTSTIGLSATSRARLRRRPGDLSSPSASASTAAC